MVGKTQSATADGLKSSNRFIVNIELQVLLSTFNVCWMSKVWVKFECNAQAG